MASSRQVRLLLTYLTPTHLITVRFALRRREENGGIIMTRQMFRERECIHRDEGAEGDFYNGVFYIQALQRLPVDQAVKVAGKVSSFFWADAPHIIVWLCDACAGDLRLTDTPRAVVSSAVRRA